MSVNPHGVTMNLSLDSEIFENSFSRSTELFNTMNLKRFHALMTQNDKFFQELTIKNGLKLIPIYNILRDNLEFSQNTILAQIDHLGNEIPRYFCPNNPKLDLFIKKVFKSYNNSYKLGGIQLDGLELPPLSPQPGCFCEHCLRFAAKSDLDLMNIATKLRNTAFKKKGEKWFHKTFPDWMKFRVASVNNLAGRLMVMVRKINPDLTLGVNLQYSKRPEYFGHDYFFLALFLDLVTFQVDHATLPLEKKLLKQIRSVTKKFLGEVKVSLQIKVPHEFNGHPMSTSIDTLRKYSFDGLVFHISTLEDLEMIVNF